MEVFQTSWLGGACCLVRPQYCILGVVSDLNQVTFTGHTEPELLHVQVVDLMLPVMVGPGGDMAWQVREPDLDLILVQEIDLIPLNLFHS